MSTMRGITPPVSMRRRTGLEREQIVPNVTWDGLVPPQHRAAFAHRVVDPQGRVLAARWQPDTLFGPDGGAWWVEGLESGRSARRLSAEGWAYKGPLLEPALREIDLFPRIRAAIAAAGSQDAWARRVVLPAGFVSELLAGKRPFSDRALAALGLRRLPATFAEVSPAGDAADAAEVAARASSSVRQTLLWLRADGTPRKRQDVVAGEWRPNRDNLGMARAQRLAEETAEGWAATAGGLAVRACLEQMRDGLEVSTASAQVTEASHG